MRDRRHGEGKGEAEEEGARDTRVPEPGAEAAAGTGEGDIHVVFRRTSLLRVGPCGGEHVMAKACLEDAFPLV